MLTKGNGITIEEMFQLKVFEGSKIIAGSAGVGHLVTAVNIMADSDTIDWVNENQFLIVTWKYFKYGKLQKQIEFIKSLHEKGLAGIGVTITPNLKGFPDEIIAIADEIGFVIIDLASEIAYSDVVTTVYQEIFQRQTATLRRLENLHKDTMNIVVRGGGMKDILRSIGKNIDNPVVVKDNNFEEIFMDGNVDAKLFKAIEEDVKSVTKQNYALKFNRTVSDSVTIDEVEYNRIVVPIIVKNGVHGHLIAYGIKRKFDDFDVLYLENNSNIVAMEFLKRLSIHEVENRYKAEFFDDLISNDQKRKEKALERANYYRFDKDAGYSIFSIKLIRGETAVHGEEEFSQTISRVMYIADYTFRNESRSYIVTNKGNTINCLIMWKSAEDYKKNCKKIADNMGTSLENKLNSAKYKIGIGRFYEGIIHVHKSLLDAEKAMLASGLYTDDAIIEFENLGIYKLFCQDSMRDELMHFYKMTLEPLVIYDKKRDTELVKSLMMYFEANGNLKKMSEILFTHYNTILYRMNRIQEITNKNLENEADRYGLQTALKIMQILNIK